MHKHNYRHCVLQKAYGSMNGRWYKNTFFSNVYKGSLFLVHLSGQHHSPAAAQARLKARWSRHVAQPGDVLDEAPVFTVWPSSVLTDDEYPAITQTAWPSFVHTNKVPTNLPLARIYTVWIHNLWRLVTYILIHWSFKLPGCHTWTLTITITNVNHMTIRTTINITNLRHHVLTQPHNAQLGIKGINHRDVSRWNNLMFCYFKISFHGNKSTECIQIRIHADKHVNECGRETKLIVYLTGPHLPAARGRHRGEPGCTMPSIFLDNLELYDRVQYTANRRWSYSALLPLIVLLELILALFHSAR